MKVDLIQFSLHCISSSAFDNFRGPSHTKLVNNSGVLPFYLSEIPMFLYYYSGYVKYDQL